MSLTINATPLSVMSTPALDPFDRAQVDNPESVSSDMSSGREQVVKGMVPRLESYSARLNEARAQSSTVSSLLSAKQAAQVVSSVSAGEALSAGHLKDVKLAEALEGLSDNIAVTQVHGTLLQAQLHKVAPGLAGGLQINAEEFAASLNQLKGHPEAPTEGVQYYAQYASGKDDFFAGLSEMISFIREDYLAAYEHVLEQYSNFYKRFNEEIMAKMGGWITGKEDGKKVEVNGDLFIALRNFRKSSLGRDNALLYPPSLSKTGVEGVSKQEAEKWYKTFAMENTTCLWRLDDGSYCVLIDAMPIDNMAKALAGLGGGEYEDINTGAKDKGKTITLDSAKFQAWQTGFNSQEAEMKNKLQLYTTKYSNANSYHENFNKILSSQLSQYAEMLKAIVSGI